MHIPASLHARICTPRRACGQARLLDPGRSACLGAPQALVERQRRPVSQVQLVRRYLHECRVVRVSQVQLQRRHLHQCSIGTRWLPIAATGRAGSRPRAGSGRAGGRAGGRARLPMGRRRASDQQHTQCACLCHGSTLQQHHTLLLGQALHGCTCVGGAGCKDGAARHQPAPMQPGSGLHAPSRAARLTPSSNGCPCCGAHPPSRLPDAPTCRRRAQRREATGSCSSAPAPVHVPHCACTAPHT
jgi:hypothetical protein